MRLPAIALCAAAILAGENFQYKVLATNKTGTMEREMNEAAEAGYVFSQVMGGETAGGNEAVVVMAKAPSHSKKSYKLLATSKTSTMQKELQAAGDEGFEYRGQTVFESTFGGRELAVIVERDTGKPSKRLAYRVLATSRTSTLEKELKEAGSEGYRLLGFSVGKTRFGGNELVSILRKD